jgi:hypothetical protein
MGLRWGVLVGWLFVVSLPTADGGTVQAVQFDTTLGQVVDPTENIRYTLFGGIEGFESARLYRLDMKYYSLHLLRNRNSHADILILDWPRQRALDFLQNLDERIQSVSSTGERPDAALVSVDSTQWHDADGSIEIMLQDGNRLHGHLHRVEGDTLVLETTGGITVPIPDRQVRDVVHRTTVPESGSFYRNDPSPTRLFFAPTARNPRAGGGVFADYYVFFPTLTIGIFNSFSLSGGISIFPGASDQLIYGSPKVTARITPTLSAGAGVLYMGLPGDEDDVTLGYLVTTIGSTVRALTLGAGWVMQSNADNRPGWLMGGELQVSNSLKLISENWFVVGDDSEAVFSVGVRFFGDHLAADFGLFTTSAAWDNGGWPFLPWVDFSVTFGR